MENTQNKKLIFVGFFTQQLRDLIEHLETTGYNQDDINHLKGILSEPTNSSQ